MDSSMVFSHLSYPPPPPPPNVTAKTTRQGSPNSSPTCDQLGGLLPYTPPIPSAPENHLMGLYTPTYAAAQSRLFSTGFAPGPPVSSGPESPTTALYSSLAPPPNPASMSPMSPMYNSQAAAAAAAWRAHPPSLTAHQPPCGPYDHHGWHPAYSYAHNSTIDLNSARRKNATRESTATLKAWLQEHIKNPYPTKGEKIMLAIITKMTLTQVSTWFANARRRLKKENKMTWSPRNRGEDEAKESEDESLSADNKSDYGRGADLTPINTAPDSPEPKYPAVHAPPPPSGIPGPFEALEERPKIWSLANTAAACSPAGLSKAPVVVPSEESKPFYLPP